MPVYEESLQLDQIPNWGGGFPEIPARILYQSTGIWWFWWLLNCDTFSVNGMGGGMEGSEGVVAAVVVGDGGGAGGGKEDRHLI